MTRYEQQVSWEHEFHRLWSVTSGLHKHWPRSYACSYRRFPASPDDTWCHSGMKGNVSNMQGGVRGEHLRQGTIFFWDESVALEPKVCFCAEECESQRWSANNWQQCSHLHKPVMIVIQEESWGRSMSFCFSLDVTHPFHLIFPPTFSCSRARDEWTISGCRRRSWVVPWRRLPFLLACKFQSKLECDDNLLTRVSATAAPSNAPYSRHLLLGVCACVRVTSASLWASILCKLVFIKMELWPLTSCQSPVHSSSLSFVGVPFGFRLL